MPLEIDERWEYWEPDPDVAWVMARNWGRVSLMEMLRGGYEDNDCRNLGMRFGSGSWNSCHLHQGPPKKGRWEDMEPIQEQTCPTCERRFLPRKRGAVYCGVICVVRLGRSREAPRQEACRECGGPMDADSADRIYCSRRCASKAANRVKSARQRPDRDRFIEMWESGASRNDLARAFGISVEAVKRWRVKFGLSPRPEGNHSGR